MDMKEIGKFLAELRHKHNLTQEELGEELGVTNKTISRWENGNYLPPVEMLLLLSKRYEISINEILSGKTLDGTDYKEKAEENLKTALENSAFTLQERIAFFEKKWLKEHTLEMALELIIIISIAVVGFIFMKNILTIISTLLVFIWSIYIHNRKSAYVENMAYPKSENK
ncbi:MAG: helix-turn-helix transcriptional regulator [Anaeroplasmataceae bacterium]|nr:helix-turn-helix transcriptional regulator [Anaeroplasmataceae bacterium]